MSFWKKIFGQKRGKFIGNAKVICAISKVLCEKLSLAGHSDLEIAAVQYAIARGKKSDLVLELDGTYRLSNSGLMKLKSTYGYMDGNGILLVTDNKIEGLPEYKYIGALDNESFAVAICKEHNIDARKLRV